MPKAPAAAKKASPPARKTAAKTPAPEAPVNEEPLPTEEEAATGSDWFVSLGDVIDHTNTLLYGREGAAKTTNAARIANAVPASLPPGKGKVLVINAEGGLRKQALSNRGVNTDRIVLWPDPRSNHRVTHKALDTIHRKLKADLADDPESWFAVVFDSATEIHTALLDVVQQQRVQSLRDRGIENVDEHFVDVADYGKMSKAFRDILRKFRDLPCHFVVTALERRDVDKDTGKPQYGPAVTPGLQSDLLGYVDFVLMCKAADEDGPYRALTRSNSRYRAKDRFDVLPKVLATPFMDRVLGYVTGELTEENDEEQQALPSKATTAQDAIPLKEDADDEGDGVPSDDD